MFSNGQIGKPARCRYACHFSTIFYVMKFLIGIWHLEEHTYIKIGIASANFVFLKHLECFFVSQRVGVTNNDKLFSMLIQ